VPSSSAILSMNPFLDPQGLIRACGRVAASESLQYNERHPVILPYNCLLSRLLANFTHRITLHGGNQFMVRLIRSKYWIPRIKNLMKAVVNSCKVCVIHKKRLQSHTEIVAAERFLISNTQRRDIPCGISLPK